MNEYLSQIFAAAQGQEIDPDVAAAGVLLSKVAEEEGVDLDNFSDDDVASMLQNIMGADDEGGEETISNENTEEPAEEPKTASDLTVADISAELSKVAAEEGIDLTTLDRGQYHDAFNFVHQQMTDPTYFETKVAMEEKTAEADMLGRVMAHSFNDELEKMAREGGEKTHKKSLLRRVHEDSKLQKNLGTATGGAGGAMMGGMAGASGGGSGKVRAAKAALGAVAGGVAGGAAGRGLGALNAGANKMIYKGVDKLRGSKGKDPVEKTSGVTEQDLLEALTEFGWDFS